MRKTFWLAVLSLMLACGGAVFGAGLPAQVLNQPEGGVAIADDGDEKPEVTARVARISFVSGDVKIKRIDSDTWEKAVLNLPLIEGDEIATGPDARLELQFNNYVHIRLDHDSYLKFAVMKDEGVAVSLSQGTMNIRITDLDRAGGYFEIDAPKTTVAVEKSGSYRIDAGKAGDKELHVSVTNGGAARIYSENAGFTLKSGRGARVFIDGDNAGEWETAEAAKFGDDFDAWAESRDSTIAKRLAAAYYDKYYDQDIYGADDLNDYGEWVYTSAYGYVWRPYAGSINSYANWSPYRYGHWRWVGAFGWVWINDEPWGWATYHHGRWVWDQGHWVWCPYGYYRPKRSWWFPALVVINIFNSNVCWYPLGYHHHWNGWGGHHGGNNGWGGNGGNGNHNPNAGTDRKPGPGRGPIGPPIRPGRGGGTVGLVPENGVVAVAVDEFGLSTKGGRTAPKGLADEVLAVEPGTAVMPERGGRPGRKEPDFVVAKPRVEPVAMTVKTGAAVRRDDAPLDAELRTKRIFGERKPVVQVDGTRDTIEARPEGRPTGAVDRSPRMKPSTDPEAKPVDRPIERRPRDVTPETVEQAKPVVRETKPREQPRSEPVRPQPREEQRPPRSEPPPRQPPSTPRSEPPPKSEPKPESKPAEKPTVVDRKGDPKDGR